MGFFSKLEAYFPIAMPIYDMDGGVLVVYYNQRTVDQVDYLLSKKLEKYYSGLIESERNVENALLFSFQWCSKKMLELLHVQTQVNFFQAIFFLHEISCPYTELHPGISPVPAISNWDFGIYRRVLKLCLEQACDLDLKDTDPFSLSCLEVIEPVLSELTYLGILAFQFSAYLAEEKLCRESVLFSFEKGRYKFQRTQSSELRVFQVLSYVKNYKSDAYDKSALANFICAVKNCFGIEFEKVVATITFVHEHYKDVGGRLVLIKWQAYPALLEQLFNVPSEKSATFLKGLTLSRANKLSLEESIYRTDSLNRYLYRPILLLNVNNEELTLIGHEAFDQSIVSLCLQAFGWRKFPVEWKNTCFENYIEDLVEKNDKILEDAIEAALSQKSVLFDRNIRNLLRKNNRNRSIVDDPGEIDFLFVYMDVLYVAESKHQMIRYDMNNFAHDSNYFKRNYNANIAKKVIFIKANLAAIKEHFRVKEKNIDLDIKIVDVQGLFIVNTPTFLMFDNEFPVFGLPQLERYFNTDISLEKMIEIDMNIF